MWSLPATLRKERWLFNYVMRNSHFIRGLSDTSPSHPADVTIKNVNISQRTGTSSTNRLWGLFSCYLQICWNIWRTTDSLIGVCAYRHVLSFCIFNMAGLTSCGTLGQNLLLGLFLYVLVSLCPQTLRLHVYLSRVNLWTHTSLCFGSSFRLKRSEQIW